MTVRIYSKKGLQRIVDDTVGKAYERRKHSVDFLLLFSVQDREKDCIAQFLQENPLILTIRWRFETLMFTAYIKS